MTTQATIVITGLGLVSSLGVTPEETFDAILAGRCGIGPMSALEQNPVPDKGGGQAKELASSSGEDLPREVRYLRHTVRHALGEAGPHPYPPGRVAAVLGTTLHGMRAGGAWLRTGDASHLRRFPAGAVLDESLRDIGVDGSRLSTCSACSSGLGAIAIGLTLLRSGGVDMVIAGGYDTVSEYVYAGFDSLRLVAAGNPRPFGAARDGMKTSEGYAVVVLEREADASARIARVRGYVAGFGESADAHHLTQPHPQGTGARTAIDRAARCANIALEEIGLISAHATATPDNDAAEYAALKHAFGPSLASVPTVAFKGSIGHTLGGAGAVELVLSVLARERGLIPPTLNAQPVDPRFTDLRLNHGSPIEAPIASTLNLSLGFGGANTCVILTSRRPTAESIEREDVVVTGIGVVLSDVVGNDRFLEVLRAARGGVVAAHGPVPEASIASLLQARRVRRMSDYVKSTLAAARLACDDAKITEGGDLIGSTSVVLGTMHGSSGLCDSYYSQIVRDGIAAANPVLFAEGVPNAAAAHLSLAYGITGSCQTIIGSRTSGLDALALAAMRIREGVWTRACVGAGEEYCDRVNRAVAACTEAAGAHFGAGAVVLTLESRRAAEARGIHILGSIGESWSVASGIQSVVRAVESAREAAATSGTVVATSLGLGRAGGLIRRGLEASAFGQNWHTSDVLPECFSIGGLAAVAGVLLNRGRGDSAPASGKEALVVATGHDGGGTGVVVRW